MAQFRKCCHEGSSLDKLKRDLIRGMKPFDKTKIILFLPCCSRNLPSTKFSTAYKRSIPHPRHLISNLDNIVCHNPGYNCNRQCLLAFIPELTLAHYPRSLPHHSNRHVDTSNITSRKPACSVLMRESITLLFS